MPNLLLFPHLSYTIQRIFLKIILLDTLAFQTKEKSRGVHHYAQKSGYQQKYYFLRSKRTVEQKQQGKRVCKTLQCDVNNALAWVSCMSCLLPVCLQQQTGWRRRRRSCYSGLCLTLTPYFGFFRQDMNARRPLLKWRNYNKKLLPRSILTITSPFAHTYTQEERSGLQYRAGQHYVVFLTGIFQVWLLTASLYLLSWWQIVYPIFMIKQSYLFLQRYDNLALPKCLQSN